MKKRLFCLFVFSLLLMSIQVVFAEKISYEWGDYFSSKDVSSDDNRVYDVVEKDGGYFIYWNKVAHLYDKDGKVLNEKYDSNEYEYEYIYYDEESKQFFGDVKWREFDENNEYLEYRRAYVILDENRKEIKMVDADDYDYYYDVINDNNNYYVLINLDSGVILVKKDLSSVERFDYEDLTDKELKDYLGEYYDIVKLNISNEDSNKYY